MKYNSLFSDTPAHNDQNYKIHTYFNTQKQVM